MRASATVSSEPSLATLMQSTRWPNTAVEHSQRQAEHNPNWPWDHHKHFVEPVDSAYTQHATGWALKSSTMHDHSDVNLATRQEDHQQQQQFADYWSQQDDTLLSPYLPGHQGPQSRPDSSPAVSIEPAQSYHEGMSVNSRSQLWAQELQCSLAHSGLSIFSLLQEQLQPEVTWDFLKSWRMTVC